MENIVLDMQNISKSFPGVQALDKVKLTLRKGEVHALLGENGAGKSTLMKVLMGIYKADEGTIIYQGKPVTFTSPLNAQENGVSMIFQELNLIPHLSVAENIFLAREPVKSGIINKKYMMEESQKLLDLFDISVKPSDIVHTLSVAEQQMVEIAKAISLDVEVLIMDEPTSALTDKEIDKLFQIVQKLKSQDVCIVYISHRMEELKRICDHVSIFRDGRYVVDCLFSDISIDEIIAKMVGRSLDSYFPEKENQVTSEILLSIKGLERKGVFAPISFDLHKGEVLGITGLVGAKRTELARAIFGADSYDSGEIILGGETITIHHPSDAVKAGIAYLSEDRKLNGIAVKMNVRENITMAALDKVSSKVGIISKDLEQKACQKYVDMMNIRTPSIEQIVHNLSGGNQQKVVISKWLLEDAKIMIFDEPTRGIDVGAKYAIYELINELSARGVGVIMISSELLEILGVADRTLVMKEGELTGILDVSSTSQEEIMQYATGVKNMMQAS